ncbi:N-acetylmuramoyl-L-alanine amidase [Sinomicrobium sp. M5D2P9]
MGTSVSFGNYKPGAVMPAAIIVRKAYFAKKKTEPIIETTVIEHEVKAGDNLGKIAKKYNTTSKAIVEDTNNDITEDNKSSLKIGQKMKISTQKQTGEKVSFEPIKAASLGEEVYIVIETSFAKGRKLSINVVDGKGGVLYMRGEFHPIKIMEGDKEKVKLQATVGEDNKAIVKVKLRPKDDNHFQVWKNNIQMSADKKAYLCILIDAHTENTDVKVKYEGKNKNGTTDSSKGDKANYWLDGENEWFEVTHCSCCDMEVSDDGFITHEKITKNRITALEKYDWKNEVQYIILHRTVSSSASSSLNSFKRGIGTHFLIGKDGTIYQTATLNKTTSHIRNGYNSKTIGIEVVGMPTDEKGNVTLDGKKIKGWEPLTEVQAKSTACIVRGLMKIYNLTIGDVKNHEDLQAKTAGEGKVVYDAIIDIIR